MDGANIQPVFEPLTERELQILRLISDGMSNREIAGELFLTIGTVKWYNKQIYRKLGVHSRTQAVARAKESGQLDVHPVAPAPPAITTQHNLPTQLTSFIGRERVIVEVKNLFNNTRLLTFTGPPGTGKTRLALQVAGQVLERFTDGVFFVDLTPISDHQLFSSTVAQTLGLREFSDGALQVTLQKYLRGKNLLLLLDNFEQIIEAAPLIGDLLSSSPGVKTLVTSRESLKIYGEQEYAVPPLELPDLGQLENFPEISQYEAVELFTQRARAVKPGFTITENNVSIVAEICLRLDGLPLAIELAAARSKLFSPEVMLKRLESRIGTLTGGSRDFPVRMQTLRGAIDWSYDLLDESEKTLFARLAVFQGGRTIEAAQFVCGHNLTVDIIDGLESLLNKSLLRHTVGQDGESRFVFLETIYEYARERLEGSGEAGSIRERHAEYFLTLAERAVPELYGTQQVYWFARLRVEHDNLQTALAWSLESGEIELGLRMVGALQAFWYNQGPIAEGLSWAESFLESAGDAYPTLRAKALNTAGDLAFAKGDHERGILLNREALSLARKQGDRVNQAWALIFLAARHTNDPDKHRQGIQLSEEGLVLFRELDDKPSIIRALNTLGELSRSVGDYERARVVYEECLSISRELDDRHRQGVVLGNLGIVALYQGEYKRAETLIIEALILQRELKSNYFTAYGMAFLAGPVAAQGHPERAARLLGASETLFELVGVGLQPVDQLEIDRFIESLRKQIDEETFETAWMEGRAMSLEQAIEFALGE